jgi:hypothetical protein
VHIVSKIALHHLSAATLALLLAGCDTGPSESEFAAACMQEGQRGVNKALNREMGLDRAAFCECAAKEAKVAASPDGYQWMMLDMQGKNREAAALHAKMSDEERTGVMQAGIGVLGKCFGMRR